MMSLPLSGASLEKRLRHPMPLALVKNEGGRGCPRGGAWWPIGSCELVPPMTKKLHHDATEPQGMQQENHKKITSRQRAHAPESSLYLCPHPPG
jgi:hypothetical protein